MPLMPKRTKYRKPHRLYHDGKAKGNPELWVAVVKEGKIMFEIAGVSEEVAREALRLAMHKLPVKCKFVKREESGDVNEN